MMPSTYRALVCDQLSGDLSGLSIRDLPIVAPGAGEVAIRVRAAALNFPDLLMSAGGYQLKPPLPFVLGMEGAGEVVEVGEGVTGLAVGDRVSFGARPGSFAERAVVNARAVMPAPPGFDFGQASAWRVTALTAWVALVRRGQLAAGETLLVHGASGGTGVAAVQLGRHLGATVIATGTSDEKLAPLRALGADHLLNLRDGFREQVKALTGGRGADVIYDPVGGDVFDESARCIAWGGRLLVIGFAGGRIPSIDVNMPLIKGFSVVGVRAGEYGRRDPVRGAENERDIERLAAQGVFTPLIGARFPFDQVLEAMRALAQRRHPGKIVLEM
jgi:NADPH2:quinone reductase